jgi:hypothetical protein
MLMALLPSLLVVMLVFGLVGEARKRARERDE